MGSSRRPHRRLSISGLAEAVVFAGPMAVLITLFIVAPLAITAFRSLYDWDPGFKSPFVGLSNYTDLFTSEEFHQILWNEAVFLLGIPLWVIAPLVISWFLYQRVAGAAVVRSILFFPSILSPVIIAILFRALLAQDGLVNQLLAKLGVTAQPAWLDDAALVKPVIILILAWAGVGQGVMIFSSAMSSIPSELFDAARVDGAGWWMQLRHVVVPAIRDVIQFWAIVQAVSVFAWIFGWIFVLTQGGPGLASTTLDYSIYLNGLQYGKFGVAAAEAVIMLLIVLGVIALGGRLGRGDES